MIDLKKYRKNKRIDQKSLSDITGVDQSIISKYENGISVSYATTERLLKAIPELNDYLIEESIAEEPPAAEYGVRDVTHSTMMKIIEDQAVTIKDLTRTNTLLTERLMKLEFNKY